MRRLLLSADLVALLLSFLVVDLAFAGAGPGNTATFDGEFALFVASLPAWIVLAKLYRLYDLDDERANHSTADELVGVFHVVTVGAFLFFAGSWFTGFVHPTPGKIVSFWALAVVAMTVARSVARILCRRHPSYVQRALIVGAGDVGQLLARKLIRHPEYAIEVAGFIDSMPKERQPGLGDLTILGEPSDLPALVDEIGVERVIVAFSNERYEDTLALIRSLSAFDVCIDVVPRLYPLVGRSTGTHSVEGVPLIALPRPGFARSTALIKRSMDLSLAVIALVLLAPLFAAIALRVRMSDSSAPVLFHQMRVGKDGELFELLKFRTMGPDAEERKSLVAQLNQHDLLSGDSRMFKARDDPRVTSFGRWLRRYSLDELPQLFNVIRGDMSLVGPRPLIPEEDRHVVDWRRRRLSVRPGMTGLWQVYGRDEIPFEEMVELDYRYVADWSPLSDVGLLLRTLPAIVRERSAY